MALVINCSHCDQSSPVPEGCNDKTVPCLKCGRDIQLSPPRPDDWPYRTAEDLDPADGE
jgi:hypothetical protein